VSASTRLRIVGALFIAAFPLYAGGQALLSASSSATMGLALVVLNTIAVIAIGLLLRPVIAADDAQTAQTYLIARIAEGVLLSAGAVALLQGYEAGNDWGYRAGMAALALGSLPFCFWLWRTRRAPRWFAILGLAGYVMLFAEIVSEAIGATVLWLLAPGAVFELAFGVWLLSGVKTGGLAR
jgi:hypothetical protein